MHVMEIKYFNSRLYFYCIDQGVNPSAIIADLNRVPPIVEKEQSHAELPKELWNRTEQMEGHKRAMSSRSYQPDTLCISQLGRQEQSHSTRTKLLYSSCLPSWGYGKGKKYMQLPYKSLSQR